MQHLRYGDTVGSLVVLKLRYKDAEGHIQLAHTLNGSSLALPRIVAALLENNQTPDGITVPKVLHEYTRFFRID